MYHFLTYIHPSWHRFFDQEFGKEYIQTLRIKLNHEYTQGKTILPPTQHIFHAFEILPLDQVRVVILGQDPYHGVWQAHGLSFSVPLGVRLPPSLINIYKEIESDCHVTMNYQSGDLTHRSKQGILLLNASLTVLEGQPNSHASYGRHTLTDHLISYVNTYHTHLIFILWGNFAKKKAWLIDQTKHTILTSAHPSPLSAYQWFFGAHHFSQCNTDLQAHGYHPVVWSNVW